MLHTISWQQYFLFLFIAAVIYYIGVWILYYKAKLPSFSLPENFRSPLEEEDIPNVQSTAWEVIQEITPLFPGRQNQNELIYAIQTKLKKYHHWDEPGFRETINAFILGESENKCSIHLSEEDLRVLWI
jgi:hypothetical protein